jgi:hypothetical protein
MNAIERALRDFLAARPGDVAIAVVGGIAVSVRTEPRFTRDLDFAVAITDEAAAEHYVFRLRQQGYEIAAALEQTTTQRLSTIRLRRRGRGPLVDLLFAAAGIEVEVVRAAEPIEIGTGLIADVARVGHLIAMKLVSCDDERRPQDRADLAALAKVADATEWARAEDAIRLIEARGFARKRDLAAALIQLRTTSPGSSR